jgi:hypothetical protein
MCACVYITFILSSTREVELTLYYTNRNSEILTVCVRARVCGRGGEGLT